MNVENLLKECEIKYGQSEYEKTIEICDEILKTDLNNQTALGYKARCLNLLNRNEEALTLLNNAIRVFAKNTYFLDIKCDVLMDDENYAKAIECFEKILQIGVNDETALDFIKRDYEICLSLRIDQLIEAEKYADAWKCYQKQLKVSRDDLKPQEAIRRFKMHVARYTSRIKSRKYHVRVSSETARLRLFEFLRQNGFAVKGDSGILFLIDVIDKTCMEVSVDSVGASPIISESKFYDKVNYYPQRKISRQKKFDEKGNILYDGLTLYNAPYGFGKAYFPDGTIYREGIFDIKGIVQGREYYPSGRLRFEGRWCLTYGYGPNAPCDGNAYDEDGNLIYSGKFEIKRGGVGWPMIQKPKGFALEQKKRPKIEYC